jgi:uncharacterized protein (TIGR02145 family)
MKKKHCLYVALASVMLATSCSNEQDTMEVRISNRSILLNPTVPHAASSRAVETTIDNLDAFKVTAFLPGADNYMENVAYTKADGAWSTNEGNFFWPTSSEYLNFYAYAPAEPCKMATSEDADGASFSIDHQFQKLENFSPKADAAEQKDFIYAYAKGNLEENGTDGVDIKFKHALSQITVAAKNDNKAYTVKVSGVKIGNVMSKSTFSFPSTGGDGTDASWTQDSQTGSYTTEWESGAVELSSDVKDFKDQGNVPFMLIPQALTSANKAADGAYIALKVSIAMQGGKVLCSDKWAYVGIGDSWQMGKRYNYTLDFSNGAGQDEEGNQLISGKDIKLNVNIGDWTAEGVNLPNYSLPELPATANCLILDPTGANVGKIDVVNNINIFWSNPNVGDAANVLDKKSEWVAEVIWQDINSRAINFCNASGNVISGNTYEGKGNQPLYVKTVGGKKGNIVVGVKKKGAGNDAYLWSWHLWITEEPQLVGGFMDRNLGAMSATPSDGAKTHGLYYQFGRKDPFTGDIDRYDINGTSIGKTTVTSGKVTFAKAMQTPAVFYTYGNSSTYDWASPNNYTSKKWNDITDAAGKSLFDPSPKGWRLPNRENFSNFSTTTFTWDSSNKGRTYEGNWFPAAGYRLSYYGSVGSVGSNGNYWSSSPYNGNYGYSLDFSSGDVIPSNDSNRAVGFSVRCVQE